MKQQDEQLLIELLLNELHHEKELVLRERLKNEPELSRDYELFLKVWQEFQELPLEQSSSNSEDRFNQWLMKQENESSSSTAGIDRRYLYPIAAGVLILLGFLWFINQPQSSIQQQVPDRSNLHWTSAKSTASRIQGVHSSLRNVPQDPEIIAGLLKVLRDDKSPNVRLTVVDALGSYGLDEQIKEGLLEALENEKTPVVQIAIIHTLVGSDQKEAKPLLQDLLDNKDVESYVKDEAQLGLMRL